MRVLAISSAYGGAEVALVQDNHVLAAGRIEAEHGLAASLPVLVADVMAGGLPDLVAAVTGPGSFTGLRAGLSVAHGVGLGAGVPAVGITVAEALAEEASPMLAGRALWTAIAARTGRVFLHHDDGLAGWALDALPVPAGRVAVCGNAANLVAASWAARGHDVMLMAYRTPACVHVAAIARHRARHRLAQHPALPLYVDAPEARPARGLRPPPQPAVTA